MTQCSFSAARKSPPTLLAACATVEVYPIGNVGAASCTAVRQHELSGRLDRPDLGESLAQKDLGDLQLRPALQQEKRATKPTAFRARRQAAPNPGSDLDAQLRGIDGDERLHCVGIVPDAEPFAPDDRNPLRISVRAAITPYTRLSTSRNPLFELEGQRLVA